MLAQLQRRLLELEAENQQLRTELAARKTARCDGQNVQSTSTCPGVHVHAAEVARVTGELERANEQLRAAFDAMADGLVIQGADGAILKANRAAQRSFGSEP